MIFSRPRVNGKPVKYDVGHTGLHAHGWDALIPTDVGVYDGLQGAPRYCYAALQEAPRYVYPMGENIRGSTCYAVMGGHMVCGEARRMVWNLRPSFTPWKCGVRIPLGQKAGEPLWVKQHTSAECKKR